MTADEFRAWLDLMKDERGWSQAECARRLGTSANSVTNWAKIGTLPYVDLAVTAVMLGLPRWPIELKHLAQKRKKTDEA